MRKLTEVEEDTLADEYAEYWNDIRTSSVRKQQETEWAEWHRLYKGIPIEKVKNFPWAGASNIVVPMAGMYCDMLVARIIGSVFTVKPHWVLPQQNKRWAQHCDPTERWMDWQRQFAWNQKKVITTGVLEMVKIGTAVWHNGWRDEVFYQLDQDGKLVPSATYRGPWPEWLPRRDFFLPEGFSDLQRSPVVFARFWYTWGELQALEQAGVIDNIDDIQEDPDDADPDDIEKTDGSGMPVRVDLVKLWQVLHVWMRDDIDEDGYPESYGAMLHPTTKTWLKFQPNPYPKGERPFFKSVLVEQEGEFDGEGLPSQLLHFQEEASTMHNQRRDNATIGNTVMLKARKGSGVKDKEKIYPGRIFLVTDTKDLEPFTMGTRNSSADVQEEQLDILLAEKRIGISDLTLGRENSPLGRAAATTVMALMQENARRFEFNTARLHEALTEQGTQNVMMWQTHGLPKPEEFGAPEEILDDDQAALVREILTQKKAIYLSLNVATAAVNREIAKQGSMEMMQVIEHYADKMIQYGELLINPQLPPIAKTVILKILEGYDTAIRRVMTTHETYDLEDALAADAMKQLLAPEAQVQPMGGSGGGPAIPGAMGGPQGPPPGAAV